MNRRTFLRSLTGSLITVPTMGSLQPAWASQTGSCRRFVAMATRHGGIWGEHMWPDDALLTESTDVGHLVRRGDLMPAGAGSQTVISDVLTASSSRLTPGVMSQLNLLRGLDIPFYIAHHTGGYLGNFGRNDTETEVADPLPYVPTIDQLMAWSDGFYPELSGVLRRSVHYGDAMSWGWSNPVAGTGSVDRLPTTWSAQSLFDSLFGGAPASGEPRRLVVDQVLASYQRLRDGAFGPARRLSSGDRARLDAHMERLYEVERRFSTLGGCGTPVRPPVDTLGHPGAPWGYFNVADAFAYHQIWNEVVALALICGATRIATYNCVHTLEPYVGDWHQEVAHEAYANLAAEQRLVTGHRRFFDEVFCDLAERLDVPDADGQTVLHNSLICWTQESGPVTHDAISMPVITAGSAGGALRTGQYIDYRNRGSTALRAGQTVPALAAQRPGLLYGHWLAECLDACDVQRSTWQVPGSPGYGVHHNTNPTAWPAYVEGSGLLPFLRS